jgi:transcriptional regulator with XRE-family HTH domain
MDAELMPSLALRDVGALFWWLHRRGWSQTQIGAMTGQSQPEVSAIMHGRQVQAYSVVARVAGGLGIPRGYFGMSDCVGCAAGGTPVRGQGEDERDDPVLRRDFISTAAVVAAGGAVADLGRWLPERMPSAVAAPARVGASDVAQIRAVNEELRAMRARYGGGAVLDAAHGFGSWARGLLRSRASDAVGRDLRIALGQVHSMVGWTHHDAGNNGELRRHYIQVLIFAREADEPELTADALGDLAEAAILRRHPHDGLRLARAGLAAAADRVSPATTAWLHVNEARAWAVLGDDYGVREALGRAEDDLRRADPAAVPAWATSGRFLLSPGRFTGYRTRVYADLSRHPEHRRYAEVAAEQGEAALAGSDGGRYWYEVVLDRVALAAAQLRAGAREEGLTNAQRAIDEVATLRSRRAQDGLADIADAAGGYPDHRDAKDLRARLATVAAG